MDDPQQLFTELINTSSLHEDEKSEWLGRLGSEGPSLDLLNRLEAAINQAIAIKEQALSDEVDRLTRQTENLEREFGDQVKELELQASEDQKKRDKGLIAAIRAKLGL